jgi:hypothetical protein
MNTSLAHVQHYPFADRLKSSVTFLGIDLLIFSFCDNPARTVRPGRIGVGRNPAGIEIAPSALNSGDSESCHRFFSIKDYF